MPARPCRACRWQCVLLPLLALAPAAAGGALYNPGFEVGDGLDGWKPAVYGAQPTLAADPTEVHEGRQSLRVSAEALSDTALAQDVMLRPRRWYRLTGWVKTRGLDPHGAPVFGTYRVQHPDGALLARGDNHGGDTDWTPVRVLFQAPSGGLTHIALFFVGFGKGTGTAWFDDLALEEVDLTMSPIKVTREPLGPGSISPLQYGQFIEYLCDLVPSLWAEKLYDGSFEGLCPYDVAFIKETDFREKPWYPSGAVNRAHYSRVREDPVSGDVCQKTAVPAGAPATVGLSQDGIAVRKGAACRFSCFLRGEGIEGPVRVRVHREGKVYGSAELHPEGAWRKHEARLMPSGTDANATLTIEFRGPGTLWLDNASLMPEDTVGGWRRDAVEAVRALKPGIIRFGGCAVEVFDWRDTIGNPDRRKPFRAWGGLQPTGPGLEEILEFCREVGAEALMCVRFAEVSPKDAADQVEYLNGAASTPMGALRARNGHPKPYGVRYWQVGNEVQSQEYEAGLAEFCRAMKAVDPTIRLLSAFPTPGVLQSAGHLLDYVCPHHYGCRDLQAMEESFRDIRRMVRDHAPGRGIRIAVTEWNTTAGDWGTGRAMLRTLENALACARYHNLLHRYSDMVEIANRSNLSNSFCSGIIRTDNHRLYKTPTYYAQQLYAMLAGTRPLRLESDLPANVGLDVSATLSEAGDVVTLFAVNDTLEEIRRPIDLSAFGSEGREVEVWTLADKKRAGEPDVTNSFAEPERIAPVRSRMRARSDVLAGRFSPLTLTVLRGTVR